MDYDDDSELTRYVWDHFSDRMADFERRVGKAIIGRVKGARTIAPLSHMILVRWGRTDDPEINAALADGPDVFRHRVRTRVLAEAADQLFVNRCQRCQRVVCTPRARQCLWCGFDWHDTER